jgi:hypothetical protein
LFSSEVGRIVEIWFSTMFWGINGVTLGETVCLAPSKYDEETSPLVEVWYPTIFLESIVRERIRATEYLCPPASE